MSQRVLSRVVCIGLPFSRELAFLGNFSSELRWVCVSRGKPSFLTRFCKGVQWLPRKQKVDLQIQTTMKVRFCRGKMIWIWQPKWPILLISTSNSHKITFSTKRLTSSALEPMLVQLRPKIMEMLLPWAPQSTLTTTNQKDTNFCLLSLRTVPPTRKTRTNKTLRTTECKKATTINLTMYRISRTS